jgi:hypothetical protein
MKAIDLSYYGSLLASAWRLLWPVMRQVLGWIFIILGLLGLVLPVLQGVLFLVIGIALVGQRHWLLRRVRILIKRGLRRWAALRVPVIGPAGRIALRAQWRFSRQGRHLHRRYAEWAHRRSLRERRELTGEAGESPYEPASDHVS